MRQVDCKARIDHERDLLAVPGDAWGLAQSLELRLPASAQSHALDIGPLHIGRGPHMHIPARPVYNDGVPGVGHAGGIVDPADRGDAQGARDYRDMRVGATLLENKPAQALAIILKQRCRPHRAGYDDRVFRQAIACRRVILPKQLMHQPVGELVQIVQALAQIRIGGAQHARACVRLHALDCGLGGEAGRHRFFQPVHPSAVIGKHAIGLEHLPVLASIGELAAFQQHVQVRPHGLNGRFEPFQFFRHIVGNEIGDDNARLVQHDMTVRDTVVEYCPREMQRAARSRLGAGLRDGGELARGDHLGEHHRGGLQRLLFLLRVSAPRPILHDQYAKRIARPQDGDPKERVVNLFARLCAIRKGRMVLRVRQVDRVGLARNQADQAFVRPQHGLMHCRTVQAFSGVELQRAVHPQHVDRADLRHHIGGNQDHDLVQAVLRADRLRHHFAKPA